jgi:CRISPR-associated protein Cmr3
MNDIKIKALDSLFFRDPRPFTMGEDNIAANLFPQLPGSVLLGALRTAQAANDNIPIGDIRQKTADVKVHQMGIMLNDEPVFPIPADLICIDGKISLLQLSDNQLSSNPFPKLLRANTQHKTDDISGYRLKIDEFVAYLQGARNLLLSNLLRLSDYYTYVPKIGIARNKVTRTTREGALYRVNMVKTEGALAEKRVDFFARISGATLGANGFIRLGGEGKVASYSSCQLHSIDSPQWASTYDGFKIYLATPAIFTHGFLPNWLDPETLTGELAGFKVKLETAAFGRFLPLGGFDIENNQPKPVYKAVPAGSVYYFSFENPSQSEAAYDAIKNYFIKNAFTDLSSAEGLGWAIVGPY